MSEHDSWLAPPEGTDPTDWQEAMYRKYHSHHVEPLPSGNFALYNPDRTVHTIGGIYVIHTALQQLPLNPMKPNPPRDTSTIDKDGLAGLLKGLL